MPIEAAAFWSYVQLDDQGDHGRISALANHLQNLFRIRTSEELDLFVDRDSIEWGTEWAERIDDAIAGTTFFIPVITPSYFKSAACRKELMKFTREATRLGLDQLLMPIYWVTVEDLHDDTDTSSDEAVRLIASHQWQDLREARLSDESSSEYRRAVDLLASELARRAKEISANVTDAPLASDRLLLPPDGEADADQELGILDRIAQSEVAMPALTGIMGEIGGQLETIGELSQKSRDEIQKAAAKDQGIKARLRITERLAHDLDGPTAKLEELGHKYATLLLESDNGIKAQLEVLEESDAEEIGDEHREYLGNLIGLSEAADEALRVLAEMAEGSQDLARLSRSMKKPMAQLRAGIRGVVDGKGIIEDWGRRASRLLAESAT